MTLPLPPGQPQDNQDRLRLITAVTISLAILFGFNHFVEKPRQRELMAQMEQQAVETQKKTDVAAVAGGAVVNQTIVSGEKKPREQALAESTRIAIKGKRVTGSLSLTGLRLDDLSLNEHKESIDSDKNVVLMAPATTDHGFYFESGWVAVNGGPVVPDNNAVWRLAAGSAGEITSGGAPVMLEWDNGQGLLFTREISLDENFLFSVTDRVVNRTGSEVRLNPYQLVARNSLPVDFSGFFVLHEGPIGALNGKEEKLDYAEMREGEVLERKNATGWLGITDKYWMVSMLPAPDAKNNARIIAAEENGTHLYQTDLVGNQQVVAAGGVAEHATHVYAGVKRTEVMKAYAEKLGVRQLDLSLDFGMWYFITKPFYYLLHILFSTTGSIALGILLMTVVVRAGVFPLANKSFRSMARMKVISPQLQELQEKHKGDKAGLQMAIFELYKRENVNPFSGCWPILIQIPIFFALYKVILLSVELRHAPFWGWIHDLSVPDPTSMFNLFGLINWTPPQMLMIGGWPLLFCLSMIVQKRLSPPMPDPVQERIQTMFPYIITVMMAHFASGLVIYWTWSNVLSCIQQYYILKKVGGEDTSLLRGHAARRKKKD